MHRPSPLFAVVAVVCACASTWAQSQSPVADSESRDGRTNTGLPALQPSGYGLNQGARRGIRIGSARDGSVKAFIPDPCPYPYASASTIAEGIAVDRDGNLYGADFLGTIRKFVKK